MTADILEKPQTTSDSETESITQLDWDLVCCIRHRNMVTNTETRCTNPADFMMNLTCGHHGFICKNHLDKLTTNIKGIFNFRCTKCDKTFKKFRDAVVDVYPI